MSDITTTTNANTKRMTSMVDLDTGLVLALETYKNMDGFLLTCANVGEKSINGMIMFPASRPYHREYMRTAARCTISNVTKQHNQFLEKINDIIADTKKHLNIPL